ncbi:MAG: hypothetical protein ACK5QX_03490, partial [bacterium]
PEGPRIEPESMFNLSFSLADPAEAVGVSREALRLLHAKRKSAAVTKNRSKQRYGSLISVVGATGQTLAIVATIQDRTIKMLQCLQVRPKM